jgi:hypothetical protein
MHEIVREIAFDDIPAVSTADNEVVDSSGGVYLHNMPKNGLTADFDHRFRPKVTFLADSCALASCKNYGYHSLLFALSMAAFVVRWDCGASDR